MMLPPGVVITLGIIGVITGIHGDIDINYHEGPKIIGASANYVYQAYYTPKTYEDAEQECVKNNGHLMSITDGPTMKLVEIGLFDEDLLDEGSEHSFFWIGLRWENNSWSFEGPAPSSWTGPGKYVNWDADIDPNADHKHCVGVRFRPRGDFKWSLDDCTRKAPYVCMELNTKCLPNIPSTNGNQQKMQASKNNYGCTNYRSDMEEIQNLCTCNSTNEIPLHFAGNVCDDEYVTSNKICVPGCNVQHAPVPENAILLDRDRVYYAGSRVAYYCPGVFEYNGKIHPHNLIEIPCRAGEDYNKTVFHLLCHANVKQPIKETKTIHASLYYDYKLYCNHKGSPWLSNAEKYTWYHDRREISRHTVEGSTEYMIGDKSTGGVLQIKSLSEDAAGTYYCVAKYLNNYLPGNTYNITTEHHKATQDAINKWNTDEPLKSTLYLGEFYDPNGGTYAKHIAYFEKKTFEEAKIACEFSAPGGRLALVSGIESQKALSNLFSPEMMKWNYQFEAIIEDGEEYPTRFWSGMMLNLHHHYEWMDISKRKLNDTLIWRANDEGAKHDGQCAAITLHVRQTDAQTSDKLSMTAVRCDEMLPYVCTSPADQCLPPSVVDVLSNTNYQCSNKTSQLVRVKTDECVCNASTASTRFYPEMLTHVSRNHESCTRKEIWETALCIPECNPNPEYGAIVYPRKKYYLGMYMTYFCPGHFEINGIEYNHNSIAVKCNPDRKEVINLQCRHEQLLTENALVTVIKTNLAKLNESRNRIELVCNISHHGLTFVTWMIKNEFNMDVWKDDRMKSVNGDVSLLTGPSFSVRGENTLMINHVDESARGVYGCYYDNSGDKESGPLGILLPGNVYRIMFDGDEEEGEEQSVTSTSSLPSSWRQTGVYVHHAVMLILLLVFVL